MMPISRMLCASSSRPAWLKCLRGFSGDGSNSSSGMSSRKNPGPTDTGAAASAADDIEDSSPAHAGCPQGFGPLDVRNGRRDLVPHTGLVAVDAVIGTGNAGAAHATAGHEFARQRRL